jgi:hypothetical protein
MNYAKGKAVKSRSISKEVDLKKFAIQVDKQITVMPIEKIKLWKDNPKKHTEKDVAQLAEIIKSRGQISPVIVWRKNGVCYKGNGTIQALKVLKIKTVDVRYCEFPSEMSAVG